MIKNFILLIFTFSAILANSQEPYYKSYSWADSPNFSQLETDNEEDIIAFRDKIIKEFSFNDDGNLIEYHLIHKILWLNSDAVIEDHNKVYLPYSSSSKLLVTKARVITEKGKVIELDESKILTAKDEETNKIYKYFAFEGIEKGSFIEYYYVVQQYPTYKGRRVFMQSSYNKEHVEFDLISPKNLIFEFKSYNGLTEVTQDTFMKEKLHWQLHLDKINKLEKEEQSAYDASKKFLVYKLEKNTVNNKQGISSYVNTTKDQYKYLYLNLSKDQIESIDQIIEESGIKNQLDDKSKIRSLENYLKLNFYISDINSQKYKDITEAIKTKTINEVGLIRIFIAALKKIGIKTEVVITSDRFDMKFDAKFEANNFLNDYLLYFPSVKMYTSAKEINSRLGIPPANLTNNYGLFIKEVQVGNFKSGVGKIKYINPLKAEQSIDNLAIDVIFDKSDLTVSNIAINRTFSGYFAAYIQPYLNLINENEIDGFYDQIIKGVNQSLMIEKKTAKNAKAELFGIKPFGLEAQTKSESLVDKAGNKYLFKLGEVIGPQIEMYQENERHLAIETDFNRSFERIIRIKIPKGYKIKNTDDINIENYLEKDGKKILEFHSYYELIDNNLIVYANEYYKEIRIDVPFYESYRTVINSAADFNKIVLIFEPI